MFSPFPAFPFPASTMLPSPPLIHPATAASFRPSPVTLTALPGEGIPNGNPASFGPVQPSPLLPLPAAEESLRKRSLAHEIMAVFFDLILRDEGPLLAESELSEFLNVALRYRPSLLEELAQNEAFFVLPPGRDNGRGGNLYLSPPPQGGKAWAFVLGLILRVVRSEKPPEEKDGLDPAKVLRLQEAIYRAGGPPPPSSPSTAPSTPPASSSGEGGGLLVLGGLLALAAVFSK